MTQHNDTLDEDEINRLTKGTLTDGDIPDHYPDDFHTGTGDRNIHVFDTTATMEQPDNRDTGFNIHPETVPSRGTPMIDYFYGRPVLYLYTPLEEEVQYIFALPTKDDPYLRPLRFPTRNFPENRNIVKDAE